MRPREVPVAKPSAEQIYIPASLLRERGHETRRRRWLPTENKPGASKHSLLNPQSVPADRAQVKTYCSQAQADKIRAVDEEITCLEDEMDKFVEEFYVAAAMCSAQMATQRDLLKILAGNDGSSSAK